MKACPFVNAAGFFYCPITQEEMIVIGNNVHIGWGATILPNVHLGDNVIVRVGAIVTKDVKSNTTVAGIPVRTIESIEEYINKNEGRFIYLLYYNFFSIVPNVFGYSLVIAYHGTIEFLQLFLRPGTFQLSDFFHNTGGGTIGGLIYWGWYQV